MGSSPHGLRAQEASETTGTRDDTPVEAGALQEAANLSLREAADLLDWLENHYIRPLAVDMTTEGLVTVRWAA